MALLARRLRHLGLTPRVFDYRPTAASLQVHARALAQYAGQWTGASHFLGHSLGGLVILQMLNEPGARADCRAVFLGSPLNGSRIVAQARRLPLGRHLFGAIADDLESGICTIPAGCEIGMIAGSRRVGLGRLLGGANEPGDGTVALAETQVAGLREHLVLPLGHSALLTSRHVADRAASFLLRGAFKP